MGIKAPAEVKYGLIRETVSRDNNLLNISYSEFCKKEKQKTVDLNY